MPTKPFKSQWRELALNIKARIKAGNDPRGLPSSHPNVANLPSIREIDVTSPMVWQRPDVGALYFALGIDFLTPFKFDPAIFDLFNAGFIEINEGPIIVPTSYGSISRSGSINVTGPIPFADEGNMIFSNGGISFSAQDSIGLTIFSTPIHSGINPALQDMFGPRWPTNDDIVETPISFDEIWDGNGFTFTDPNTIERLITEQILQGNYSTWTWTWSVSGSFNLSGTATGTLSPDDEFATVDFLVTSVSGDTVSVNPGDARMPAISPVNGAFSITIDSDVTWS